MKRNVVYSVIFLVLLLLSVSSMLYGIINVFNIVPTIVFIGFFVYNSLPNEIIDKLKCNKAFDIAYKIITNISLFAGILCVTMFVLMILNAFAATSEKPDTVIVLGCQIKDDKPSLMLADRLDTAYDYLVTNEDAVVIVSGGQGEDEVYAESEVMKNYLVEKGIDAQRIIEENTSVNTSTNISNSKKIIEEKGLSEDVLIVTDWYHQFRAGMMAKKSGLSVSAKSTFTSVWLVEPMFFREICAIVKYLILGA
ncbi:MAG: YdcF family protein [Acutalibacteraceae bacterium]|nr:YdcF family protein [Acutalibacteraceae bacterium]